MIANETMLNQMFESLFFFYDCQIDVGVKHRFVDLLEAQI